MRKSVIPEHLRERAARRRQQLEEADRRREPAGPPPDLLQHVVVTRHKPVGLQVWYETRGADRQELFGQRLTRPFPTAKVQFIEHRDGWMWIYWLCDTLTRPAPFDDPSPT